MEPLRHALHGRQPRSEDIALRALGAANEVLENIIPPHQHIRATGYREGKVIIQVTSAAARAFLRVHEKDVLENTNDILRRRYGGPVIQAIETRIETTT